MTEATTTTTKTKQYEKNEKVFNINRKQKNEYKNRKIAANEDTHIMELTITTTATNSKIIKKCFI